MFRFRTWLIGALFSITIIGAPLGLGLMEYGKFLFRPFGQAMVSKKHLGIEQNKSWQALSMIVLIIYLPFGLILAAVGALQAVLLALTIIGIPPALVVAKSLGTYLNPINKKCVSSAVRDEIERQKAARMLNRQAG